MEIRAISVGAVLEESVECSCRGLSAGCSARVISAGCSARAISTGCSARAISTGCSGRGISTSYSAMSLQCVHIHDSLVNIWNTFVRSCLFLHNK